MTDNTQELEDMLYTLAEKSADSDSRLGYAEAYEFAEEAKQEILDWHNKQVKGEPNKCEFGHQLYGHKTAEGWCCACEADQAFWQSEVNKQIEAVLDRLEGSIDDGKLSHSMKVIKAAIEAERNKLKESTDE